MRLGFSSASRWLACPASVRLSEGVPDSSTDWADEGTAAHALAAECLTRRVPYSACSPVISVRGKTFPVGSEMAMAVMRYCEVVNQRMSESAAPVLLVERKVVCDSVHPLLAGTCDAAVVDPFSTLTVFDLKYGEGVLVSAIHNTQLLGYARGLLQDHPDCETVELVVVQPRVEGETVSRWVTTADEVIAWGDDVLRPAAELAASGDCQPVTGSHCRFCAATAVCPAVRREVCSAAAVKVDEQNAPVGKVELPNPETLTPEQLLRVHELAPLISKWVKAVDEYVHARVAAGDPDLPLKLVAGRLSRRWSDENEVARRLAGRVTLYRQTMLSVKAVLDGCRIAGIDQGIVSDLVVESRAPTLVRIEDERQSLPAGAGSVFTRVPSGEEF